MKFNQSKTDQQMWDEIEWGKPNLIYHLTFLAEKPSIGAIVETKQNSVSWIGRRSPSIYQRMVRQEYISLFKWTDLGEGSIL